MDTKLFGRRQKGGMFSVYDAAVSTGKFWYVDSATGTDQKGNGQNPGAPFATINYAFSSGSSIGVRANKHDIVYAMPGHAETVATAGALDLNVAGVSVIGIGNGSLQPTVTLTDAAADIDVDAANITLQNLNFIANDDDVLVCLDVNSDDFKVHDSRFTGASVTKNFHVCVQDAAATASDRITVENCYALQPDAANTHFINFAGTPDGCIVRGNTLKGDWGTMCIGGAGIVTNIVVADNLINNASTGANDCIDFAATATGICVRNLCAGGHATDGVTATAMLEAENLYALITEDLQSKLDPAST